MHEQSNVFNLVGKEESPHCTQRGLPDYEGALLPNPFREVAVVERPICSFEFVGECLVGVWEGLLCII